MWNLILSNYNTSFFCKHAMDFCKFHISFVMAMCYHLRGGGAKFVGRGLCSCFFITHPNWGFKISRSNTRMSWDRWDSAWPGSLVCWSYELASYFRILQWEQSEYAFCGTVDVVTKLGVPIIFCGIFLQVTNSIDVHCGIGYQSQWIKMARWSWPF